MDFRFYFSLFTRRLHYFLVMLCACTAIGVTLAFVLPPVYRAEAVMIVESQQIPDELAATTVQTETTEQLQIIQQRILTRDRLLEMANRLSIYGNLVGADRMPPDEIVEDMRERIQILTTGGQTRRGPVQATIVRVSFDAETAALSAAVTNDVVTLILQENVEIRTNVAGQTLEFFIEEVNRLDRELAARGADILNFQEDHLDSLPDSLEFRRTQQSAAQERLTQIERDEASLRDQRERLVALYEHTGNVGTPGAGVTLTEKQRILITLQDELAIALAVMSPQNPRIKVLKARVAAAETAVTEEAAANMQAADNGRLLSPFEIQLADIDGKLAFTTAQKAQIIATMENLRQSIEATPGNAITYETLQRDYENLRQQYDLAVANRARAETGDTIEALAKGQRISVVEQAVAPRAPVKPNRLLLALGGFGAGIVMGLGLIGLLELLNTSVRRPVDLSNKLGITPFGTVPLIRTQWEIVRRNAIITTAFATALVAIPIGLRLVHLYVTPLDLLLARITQAAGL
jgi:uncharacterized protein involved in exopolysaccharide biosynthesis